MLAHASQTSPKEDCRALSERGRNAIRLSQVGHPRARSAPRVGLRCRHIHPSRHTHHGLPSERPYHRPLHTPLGFHHHLLTVRCCAPRQGPPCTAASPADTTTLRLSAGENAGWGLLYRHSQSSARRPRSSETADSGWEVDCDLSMRYPGRYAGRPGFLSPPAWRFSAQARILSHPSTPSATTSTYILLGTLTVPPPIGAPRSSPCQSVSVFTYLTCGLPKGLRSPDTRCPPFMPAAVGCRIWAAHPTPPISVAESANGTIKAGGGGGRWSPSPLASR